MAPSFKNPTPNFSAYKQLGLFAFFVINGLGTDSHSGLNVYLLSFSPGPRSGFATRSEILEVVSSDFIFSFQVMRTCSSIPQYIGHFEFLSRYCPPGLSSYMSPPNVFAFMPSPTPCNLKCVILSSTVGPGPPSVVDLQT